MQWKKRVVAPQVIPPPHDLSVSKQVKLRYTNCDYAASAISYLLSFAFTFFALIKSVASLVAVGLLLALSNLYQPHQKHIALCFWWSWGSSALPVQNTFNRQFTTINYFSVITGHKPSIENIRLKEPATFSKNLALVTLYKWLKKYMQSIKYIILFSY